MLKLQFQSDICDVIKSFVVEPSSRRIHPPLAKTLSQDKSRGRMTNPSPAVSRRNNVAATARQVANSPSLSRRNQSPANTTRRTQSDQRRKEPPSTSVSASNTKKGREPLTLSSLRAAAGNANPPQVAPSQPASSTPAPTRKPINKKPANKVPPSSTEANKHAPTYPAHVDYTSHTLSSSLRVSAERELPETSRNSPPRNAPAQKPNSTPVIKRKPVKPDVTKVHCSLILDASGINHGYTNT